MAGETRAEQVKRVAVKITVFVGERSEKCGNDSHWRVRLAELEQIPAAVLFDKARGELWNIREGMLDVRVETLTDIFRALGNRPDIPAEMLEKTMEDPAFTERLAANLRYFALCLFS